MNPSPIMQASPTLAGQASAATAADIDTLFCYARWLQRNNEIKRYRHVWHEVERLYRIAAEHGHRQAATCLRVGTLQGYFDLDREATLRIGRSAWSASRRCDYLAVGAPRQPSQQSIERLAHALGLDPVTGRADSAETSADVAEGTARVCHSGDICPRSGCWKIIWPDADGVPVEASIVNYFVRGGIMPTYVVEHPRARFWPFSDTVERTVERVRWGRL